MTEIALQLLSSFGLGSIAAVVVGFVLVWAISHVVAEPGQQVSILWGMIQYTKKISRKASVAKPVRLDNGTVGGATTNTGQALIPSFTSPAPVTRGADDKRLFVPGSPFPLGFEIVKPGSPLSVAKAAFPSPPAQFGHIHGSPYYELSPPEGPFERISFSFFEDRSDPLIDMIIYYFRDKPSEALVRTEALSAFGAEGLETIVSGTMIWKDIGGFHVELKPDRCLKISKR